MNHKVNANFVTGKTQWVMLVLLFAWTLAQPLAVIDSVPIETRFKLFFWKNILGVIVIIFGSTVILANLALRRYPTINKRLFLLSLPFPFFSLFNMLFRGQGTSIEEQVLYFIWPVALFVVFPAFFPTVQKQRQGMSVIWLANLAALAYGIIPYIGQENIGDWLDYRYRVYFGFLQPNIYSACWSVVFACSFYFYLNTKDLRRKRYLSFLSAVALVFIFLARSESILLFCLGMLFTYLIMESKINGHLLAAFLWIALALMVVPLANVVLDPNILDDVTSGRISVWSRSLEYNMKDAGMADYLTGRASLIAGNLRFNGSRSGFQAARAQSDNGYLAKLLQNGLVGLVLYLIPFVVMLRYIFRRRQMVSCPIRKQYTWVLGLWFGVFLAMWGLDVIPSFGNVTNILIIVASAPALVGGIYKTESLAIRRSGDPIQGAVLPRRSHH